MASKKVQTVAVIGAGAAGLCCARYLAKDPSFQVQVYEKSSVVGGTWVYSEVGGPLGVHSSIYKNLRSVDRLAGS